MAESSRQLDGCARGIRRMRKLKEKTERDQNDGDNKEKEIAHGLMITINGR